MTGDGWAAAAIAWAESVLGEPVRDVRPLEGGLTSTMLRMTVETGGQFVLRLMTNEPWRTHGAALTTREREAQLTLARTGVPAPTSVGLDADGQATGVATHLMTCLPGKPVGVPSRPLVAAMADMLATIHDVRPAHPFRTFQSWAWEAKWVVPAWTTDPASWQRAFDVLREDAPDYAPTFLHRDFSHRNLLWHHDHISGVVDWVETSTGPAWLDAGHAATNLALASGLDTAEDFLRTYATLTGKRIEPYWLIMDAVGFLPAPDRQPLFGAPHQVKRLDAWLQRLMALPR